ncbi:MAG TPA: PEPxxWA-CTERM sorting domain-containing protein [Caulobacteraceae bacterium]|nr:PEPxxWA-CTERM sorting domain-containing protein [Caulobacteraceae bacterium]
MKTTWAAVAAGLALAAATGAAATTYTVTIPGTITATTGSGPIQVGDTVTLTTTFDDNYVVNWGATGYMVAGSMLSGSNYPGNASLPTSGALNWSISVDGFTYTARDYEHDFGVPFYVDGSLGHPTRAISGPAIVFNSSGVFGVDELEQVATDGTRPEFDSVNGHIAILFDPSTANDFNALPLADSFNIRRSSYQLPDSFGQTAQGSWNFAGATVLVNGVSAVPEASAWAMMIAGFGMVGAAVRLRRRKTAPVA